MPTNLLQHCVASFDCDVASVKYCAQSKSTGEVVDPLRTKGIIRATGNDESKQRKYTISVKGAIETARLTRNGN